MTDKQGEAEAAKAKQSRDRSVELEGQYRILTGNLARAIEVANKANAEVERIRAAEREAFTAWQAAKREARKLELEAQAVAPSGPTGERAERQAKQAAELDARKAARAAATE